MMTQHSLTPTVILTNELILNKLDSKIVLFNTFRVQNGGTLGPL